MLKVAVRGHESLVRTVKLVIGAAGVAALERATVGMSAAIRLAGGPPPGTPDPIVIVCHCGICFCTVAKSRSWLRSGVSRAGGLGFFELLEGPTRAATGSTAPQVAVSHTIARPPHW